MNTAKPGAWVKITFALVAVAGRVVFALGSEDDPNTIWLVAWLAPVACVLLAWAAAPNTDPDRVAEALWLLSRQQADTTLTGTSMPGGRTEGLCDDSAGVAAPREEVGTKQARARLGEAVTSLLDLTFGAVGVMGIMSGVVLFPTGLLTLLEGHADGMHLVAWGAAGLTIGALALRHRVRIREALRH